jgi:hypothetical protein
LPLPNEVHSGVVRWVLMEVAWNFLVSVLISSYQTNCLVVLEVPLDDIGGLVNLDNLHGFLLLYTHNKGSIVVGLSVIVVLEVMVDSSVGHEPRH